MNNETAIINKATMLLIKYGIDEPYVDIEKIVKLEGLHSKSHDFKDQISGVLVIKDNTAFIGYNKNDSFERRRFTIAHELGHFLNHWNNNSNQEVFVDRDLFMMFRNNITEYTQDELEQEREANLFAASILMPKHFIEKEISGFEYKELQELEIIKKLANRFKVSVPAMTYRLTNLNMLF